MRLVFSDKDQVRMVVCSVGCSCFTDRCLLSVDCCTVLVILHESYLSVKKIVVTA